jgi:hypothetical protein
VQRPDPYNWVSIWKNIYKLYTPDCNSKNTLSQKIYLDSRRQKLESFPAKQPFELAQHKKTELCMI